VNIIYFSPTGNTKYVAKILSKELGIEKIHALEKVRVEELATDELILMFSIHAFNPTRTLNRFVKNLPTGLFKKIHLIAVGCNTAWVNEAVSVDIKKRLENKGYVVTTNIMAMPLTLVVSFPDDLIQKTIEEAKETVKKIALEIKEGSNIENPIPFKSKLIHTVGKAEDFAARFFGLELHAKKGCTSCSVCWSRCPEDNIKPNKKNLPKFGLKCMMCMRCVYECPEHVITPYMAKFLVHKKQYNINNYTK